MSNDIQRVYTFLAKQENWAAKADINGDDAIFKSEFNKYMEENFEWDGENANEQRCLINKFWNTIDTNQSGRISGTNFKNKNAIDKKELASMEDKIEMYEILNNYTESIIAPSVINNGAEWKKSVSEGLGNLIEPYIKNGGKPEDLQAYLEEAAKTIMRKATADYCATEYIENNLKQYLDEYNYKYSEDNTLKGIIDAYIHNIPKDANDTEIQSTVQKIVDSYVEIAIANGEENPDSIDLSEYGYSINENTPLNDLQKSIIRTKIEASLVAVKDLENYIDFKDEYDSAVKEFTTNILVNSKQKDYKLDIDWFNEFTTNSKEYKNILKTIEINKYVKNGDLISKLTSELGEDFANRLKNILPGEIKKYDEILEEAKELAHKGEFDNVSGELDTDLLGKWLVSKIKENIKEFYPNGLNDMSIENLNKTYDTLVNAAKENEDANGIKFATIDYCKAIAAKSSLLANAVKEVFGKNYAETIGKMLTSEIADKMIELRAKVNEIGDPENYTVTGWGNIPENVTLGSGNTVNYALNTTVNNGTTDITSDRISYKFEKNGNANVVIEGNTLTITGSNSTGYTTITVQTLVDGSVVGEKTIKVKVLNKEVNWKDSDTKYNGYISMDGGDYTENGNKTLGELYNGNGVINLLPSVDLLKGTDWKSAVATAKTGIATFVNSTLLPAARSSGKYDETALTKAAEKVIKLYTEALDHSLSNWAGKKSNRNNIYTFDNENYGYQVSKFWSNNSTRDTSYAQGCSADNNQLGLRIAEQYDDHWFQIVVNTKCVMDLFNKFYEQALG